MVTRRDVYRALLSGLSKGATDTHEVFQLLEAEFPDASIAVRDLLNDFVFRKPGL